MFLTALFIIAKKKKLGKKCSSTGGWDKQTEIYVLLYIYMYVYTYHRVDTYACLHAKSLHSCLTLCDYMDSSPPGSSVPGIL